MAVCDLCGKEGHLQEAIIEGSFLSVCGFCSRFGKVVTINKIKEKKMALPNRQIEIQEEVELIVKDYASKIKDAREKEELTQKILGQYIGEKESIIQKIESGHHEPSVKLAKKLEKFFKIKLIEKHIEENAQTKKINLNDSYLTIGDILNMKKNG